MTLLKKVLVIFFFLIPFSNSFAAMITFNDRTLVAIKDDTSIDDSGDHITGIHFNDDGTKMFVSYHDDHHDTYNHISEFNLTTPFDVSTSSYAGDDERCTLNTGDTTFGPVGRVFDLEFSNDGMKVFVARGGLGNDANDDRVFGFDLTSPYDISTCSFGTNQTSNLDSDALQNGSNAGDQEDTAARINANRGKYRIQNIEFNNDGTKLFAIFMGQGSTFESVIRKTRLLEYTLSSPYDLTTLTLVTDAGIELEDEIGDNPMGMRFSPDGKRFWTIDHSGQDLTQISLDVAFSTSSYTVDGQIRILNLNGTNSFDEPRGIALSASGLKLYIGTDRVNAGDTIKGDRVNEIDLVCPFNIFAGKCPSITEDNDRTGMALAQIEIAKRTIDHATDSALNRLKWIRRNKDKQNLTNLNIDINFTNERLASLTEVVKASAAKKKTKDKEGDIFYWSEGSIAIGRIGDTSISSTKKIDTDAITFGADKFTKENGIKGLAFRVGRNNVDVGTDGSNLDTDTYNITYYSTSPVEDDTKFLDTFFGIGKLNSNLLTVIDGRNLSADRSGHQLYGTIRIKDEIKKDNLILIPSGRFDIGHTILGSYKETGTGGIDVKEQHIRSKKIRAGISAVEDISDERYNLKRHGKIEYVLDLDRSSSFKYTYVSDGSVNFNDTLHSEALHNINGEIGIDIVLQDNFSLFLIYERNQAIGSGHTDKLHIAIGYLPNKKTNYAFSIDGADDYKSNFIISKNINDYLIDFKLTSDLMRPEDYDEIFLNLNRKF